MVGINLTLAVFLALIVLVITNRIAEQTYVAKVLLYFDIFVSGLLFRDPDITISAHCGLALRAGGPWYLCWLGRGLNLLQKNHCELAIANDIKRAQAAILTLLAGQEGRMTQQVAGSQAGQSERQ